MTSHTGRLYALALALLVFFLTWSAVAAAPWTATSATSDPRLTALAEREQRIRHESVVVARIVRHRWAVYRIKLHKRQGQIAAANARAAASTAAAPSVRVVNLPPLTITRTS